MRESRAGLSPSSSVSALIKGCKLSPRLKPRAGGSGQLSASADIPFNSTIRLEEGDSPALIRNMNRYDEIVKKLEGKPKSWVAGEAGQAIHLTEEQLDEMERTSSIILPPDYREFLRDYGNYTFDRILNFSMQPNPHPRPDLSPDYNSYHSNSEGRLGSLFGYLPSVPNAFQSSIEDQHQNTEGEWPLDCLPIGGGEIDMLGLAVSGKHVGCVYYFALWQQEDYLVAHSFDEFMHKVTLLEDE